MSDPGLARRRLWQLMSPTLPTGAFSYSGGLEAAVDGGLIRSLPEAADWIAGQLIHCHARVDVPLLARLHDAWMNRDAAAVERFSTWLRACRETAELVGEDHHQGRALATLLADLGMEEAEPWRHAELASWATLFALAMARWRIPLQEGVESYLWSWCENQVAAAVKLVPLGQTDGQRLLRDLAPTLGDAAAQGLAAGPEAIGGSAPGLAILSSLHETQYSRLFRS